MIIKVNPHKCEIIRTPINEKEINITRCIFQFDEEITDNYVKEAYFTLNGESYKQIIVDNECDIPGEVLAEKGQVELGVVAYLVENEEEIKRYNPSPAYFNTLDGSLKEAENSQPITPSEMEQFEQVLNEGLEEVANVDAHAGKIDDVAIITIIGRDGVPNVVEVYDGEDAKINGVNAINIVAGDNITLEQDDDTLIISSTGGGGATYTAGENIQISPQNVISATDTIYDDTEVKSDIASLKTTKADKSEIPDVSGFITKDVNNLTNYTLKTSTGSLIDLEINGTTYVVTLSLKDVDGNIISTDTIDLPLESVVVGGSYDSVNKKIILTLENGNTVEFSVADLVTGLQSEITSSNKLDSDLVDDTNSGNKFTSTSEKAVWNAKYDKPVGGIPATDIASGVIPVVPTNVSAFTNDAGYLTQHQDISGKLDVSKVKNTTSTTAGDVYDVIYINTMLGDIETLLGGI